MKKSRGALAFAVTLLVILGILLLWDSHEFCFSERSGFYPEAFSLKIEAPIGATIYYTLDCSAPDENGIPYTGPIRIGDASQNENVYSARDDLSTGFLVGAYTVPEEKVDKCTVVRAAYRDIFGNWSEIKTESYFVGFDRKEGYEGRKIISLVCDPDDLFSYSRGIYVLGESYDNYLNWIGRDPGRERWWWWQANYREIGEKWERPASIAFFDEEGACELEGEYGVRIQGGGSRGFLPKSLNLFAREKYGARSFETDFFGTGYEAECVTLFAGGDDKETEYMDCLAGECCEGLDFAVMHFVPYVLFLDGEYWGCYWLTEKYDARYFDYYYGIDRANCVVIKEGDLEVGSRDDLRLYEELTEEIAALDLTQAEGYERAGELIDMDSCTDYYAAEMYIARCGDWPVSNFGLWRSRRRDEGEYSDMRWRWMLFDVNTRGMSTKYAGMDMLDYVLQEDELFAKLWQAAEFRALFEKKAEKMRSEIFPAEEVCGKIRAYESGAAAAMEKNFRRFSPDPEAAMETFRTDLEDMSVFFEQRTGVRGE